MSDFITEENFYHRKWYVTILLRIEQISIIIAIVLVAYGQITSNIFAGVIGSFLMVGVILFELFHLKFFYNWTYRGVRFALCSRAGRVMIFFLFSLYLIYILYEVMYMMFPPLYSIELEWVLIVPMSFLGSFTILASRNFWRIKKKYSYDEFVYEKNKMSVIKEVSVSRDLLLKSAKEALREKDYKVALDYYDELIDYSPEKSNLWYKRGIALNELYLHTEALESFRQAFKISKYMKITIISMLVKKGKALSYEKDYQRAIEYYNQGIELFPKEAECWYWKGVALNFLKQYKIAAYNFEIALSINPQHKKARMFRTEIYRKLNIE